VQSMHLLSSESFASTFGPKAQRKRPRLAISDLSALAQEASTRADTFSSVQETSLAAAAETQGSDGPRERVFNKGQSRRIWGELYKVIDSSDVLIHVLDARDPEGTRARAVETYIKKNARHKNVIFLLNKCDLVPVWVTRRWVAHLSQSYPTLAFHASLTNPFGKGALIQLLRQYAKLHSEKKQITVGFVGYPNVGKSSVINSLKSTKSCKVAPIPGTSRAAWRSYRANQGVAVREPHAPHLPR
jgi:nuclear GTP-binding protein